MKNVYMHKCARALLGGVLRERKWQSNNVEAIFIMYPDLYLLIHLVHLTTLCFNYVHYSSEESVQPAQAAFPRGTQLGNHRAGIWPLITGI